MNRFRWHVSRLKILPATEAITWKAIDLLKDACLHGHKYAIDAVVAATALSYSGPRIILTSDVDDMKKLCGDRVQVESI
jgi:predicted nucleic acid-binding protein